MLRTKKISARPASSTALEWREVVELTEKGGIDSVPSSFTNAKGTSGVSEVRLFHEMKPFNNESAPNKLRDYLRTNRSALRNEKGAPLSQYVEREIYGALEQPVSLGKDADGDVIKGRGLLASCWRGKYLSVTIRKAKAYEEKGKAGYAATFPKSLDHLEDPSNTPCSFRPDPDPKDYLFSLETLCSVLHRECGGGEAEPGVYVIAGGTGSGKSAVVRGLIYHFLEEKMKSTKENGVRPHLLTVENPIEEFLYGDTITPDQIQKYLNLDYTPRQMPQDTPSLEQALLKDALRQTPFLVYVGEVREKHELKAVLDFAETGHAVITTIHAGSVREAMERLLNASEAESPAERGEIGRRIRALIHLDKLPKKPGSRTVSAPALWRGLPAGIAALVADGLSSILPERTEGKQNVSSWGRAYFVEKLWREQPADANQSSIVPPELLQLAMQMDMNVSSELSLPVSRPATP